MPYAGIPISKMGQPGGVAALDSAGQVPAVQLPPDRWRYLGGHAVDEAGNDSLFSNRTLIVPGGTLALGDAVMVFSSLLIDAASDQGAWELEVEFHQNWNPLLSGVPLSTNDGHGTGLDNPWSPGPGFLTRLMFQRAAGNWAVLHYQHYAGSGQYQTLRAASPGWNFADPIELILDTYAFASPGTINRLISLQRAYLLTGGTS